MCNNECNKATKWNLYCLLCKTQKQWCLYPGCGLAGSLRVSCRYRQIWSVGLITSRPLAYTATVCSHKWSMHGNQWLHVWGYGLGANRCPKRGSKSDLRSCLQVMGKCRMRMRGLVVCWGCCTGLLVETELSWKAKLLINQSIYNLTLHYGHELWAVTERMRSQIQVAKTSFHCRLAGLSPQDVVRSSALWMFLWECPTGRRPSGKPRTQWGDYISHLAWEHLQNPQEGLESVLGGQLKDKSESENWFCWQTTGENEKKMSKGPTKV